MNSRRIFVVLLCAGSLLSAAVLTGMASAADAASAPSPDLACPPCDDGSLCTVDACDQVTGTCEHTPVVCDDANPCTTDSCEPTTGCVFEPLPEGTACDDGNACTLDETCDASARCTGQSEAAGVACDDHNSCTDADTCDGAGGCAGLPLSPGTSCEDDDLCTVNDTCVETPPGSIACVGSPQNCVDPYVCTRDSCDPATGSCVHAQVVCPDDGNGCTADSCDEERGECTHSTLVGSPCDDHDPCTTEDRVECQDNGVTCHGTTVNCDDGNACTTDACDPATGACTHADNTEPCDDANACTTGDTCAGGVCAGAPVTCGGSSECFADVCDPSRGCVLQPRVGEPCNGGNRCFSGTCTANGCESQVSLCDDHDRCTNDSCADPATGECAHAPVACDDGNACTEDRCDAETGQCLHPPAPGANCDDGNVCTTDACDPATGACTHADNTEPCDDANACTTGDSCAGGVCAGAPVTCGGSSECFADVCDPSRGCVLQPRVGEPCNGGNRCFSGTCTANGCESQVSLCDDHDRCTNDSCADPATGECAHAPVACDDGNACTEDRCDAETGQCLHPPAPGTACDDGNVCTTDACDPATGACTHAANTAPCDDGNVCTTSDTCSDGFCGGAGPLDCDDGKACTIDSCHPVTGCHHAFDARLPDTDADGIPDSCDNCPAAVNRRQDDCNGNGIGDACDASLYDLRIKTTSPLGKGSGEVLWTTVCETDVRGFNVLMIDNQGNRVRLNTVPIPCSECITGGSGSYSTLIPKHKSGRNVFLEVLYKTSALLTVGPATKE